LTDIEPILQTAIQELGQALRARSGRAQIGLESQSDN
jgi:hypothetical protein